MSLQPKVLLNSCLNLFTFRMTKECVQHNNTAQIFKLLNVLRTEFCVSQNPNMRKGGLIGLAAMAIGMGTSSASYTQELVDPVLGCMEDSDSRVRFYACESLYNVTKGSSFFNNRPIRL